MSGFQERVRKTKTRKPAGRAGKLGAVVVMTTASFFLTVSLPTNVGANNATRVYVPAALFPGPTASPDSLPTLPGIAINLDSAQHARHSFETRRATHPARLASLWQAGTLTATDAFRSWLTVPPARPNPSSAALPQKKTRPQTAAIFGSVALMSSSAAIRKTIGRSLSGRDWRLSSACSRRGSGGACTSGLPRTWVSLFEEMRGVPAEEMVRRIDAEVNSRIRYISDRKAFGKRDYWAGPVETLKRASGDCEDFAILKMWMLHRLGFDLADMHIVVVRSRRLANDHAILSVRADGKNYILDSLAKRVTTADRTTGYQPVYSANAEGIWLHAFPANKSITIARN